MGLDYLLMLMDKTEEAGTRKSQWNSVSHYLIPVKDVKYYPQTITWKASLVESTHTLMQNVLVIKISE